MEMDNCPICKGWWVKCPCCDESFCPSCGMLESEAEDEE